ncbi:Asparagine synthase (glutamine-hydrolyzing) [Hahella chejuensis KCTC 2396]|uniref:asparagine synthase (glutamine-hydrolyzing) n=1 Tax=Hahella chejuensis (strain KCTC 2396) TaxID=349521 RepID=Q2S9H0_HAHCH|nr:asparagine synthase-related protein [Hahella chejuensis]ABC32704.1 Asparagine synthase (glutamine-hydrolyzing) [Hahella chejuensis KCTC 2396]
MSGIAGLYHAKKIVTDADLRAMSDAMSHRGPDGSNVWRQAQLGFCHNMLHTTPESLFEALPAESHDQRVVITADARLDNRKELACALGINRSDLPLLSDSQLILMGYLHWDLACVSQFLGDFCFAIWDKDRRRLFIAMDPMGTRSLLYFHSPDLFAFATDVKALLAAPGVDKKLDESGFVLLASGRRREAPERTCFEGITRLTGGERLCVHPPSSGQAGWKIEKRSYYTLQPETLNFKHPEEMLEAFREKFRLAVTCRMRSAFPVATLLSGGLDSSAISCMAADQRRHFSHPLIALSSCLTDQDPEQDERRFISIVARQKQLPVHYVTPTSGPAALLHQVHDMTGLPVNLNPHVYTALYAKAQSEGARIVMDGVCGEWGPSWTGEGYLQYLLQQLHWKTLKETVLSLSQNYSQSPHRVFQNDVLAPLEPRFLRNIRYKLRGRSVEENRLPLTNRLYHQHAAPPPEAKSSDKSLLGKRLNVILGGRTPREWYSPHFHIRNTFPYLDERVLKFCLGLSDEWFIQKGWRRYFIRAAMEKTLPPEIQWRRDKRPFSPNYHRLMQTDAPVYESIVQDVSPSDPVRDYIDVERIKRTIKELNQRPSWGPYNGVDFARKVVDFGVQSLIFLRWFQRL